MIQKIKIKNTATFDYNGVIIDNLQKVNFIYGSNGSGKTTISNVLQNDAEYTEKGCCIEWKSDMPVKALVYNKSFRELNFSPSGIPGVFTLGQATIEEVERIQKLKLELEKIKNDGLTKANTLKSLKDKLKDTNNELQEYCWSKIKRTLEKAYKEAFVGFLGSKETFSNKVVLEFSKNNSIPIKTETEIKEKSVVLFGQAPTTLNDIPSMDVYSNINILFNNHVWAKKIIGKTDIDISLLIQRLNINDWVNAGRAYLEPNSDVCPFCQQQTISKSFVNELESYFDESFMADSALVNRLILEYNPLELSLITYFTHLKEIEIANKKTKLNLPIFIANLEALFQQLNTNKERMHNKEKELSRSVELVSIDIQIETLLELIIEANNKIKVHNNLVQNYTAERISLINDIWRYIISVNVAELSQWKTKINGLNTGINNLNTQITNKRAEYSTKDSEIKEATRNVTSIETSINEINRTLTSYGFTNFKIMPYGNNQYQIQREDGELAHYTLSEGEMTFITFLYYLQLSKGSLAVDTITDDRILVIDDPVSSIDSTVLFVVSSLLKEEMKRIKRNQGNIKQIIILTHNVYFHKEVSFVDRSDNNRDDVGFWILRKNDNISIIQEYNKRNPIKGTYELLWAELKDRSNLSNLTIQNTLRRIIEVYFKMMGGFDDNEILDTLNNTQDKEICRSLICWINDGSHCLSDDLFVENQSEMTDRYMNIFKKIFEKSGHLSHYNMMMISNQN